MTTLPHLKEFPTNDQLILYLNECEIKQGVKFIHQRSFSEYHKSLGELNCDPRDIDKKVVKYGSDGIPYVTVSHKATLYCQHGYDQNVKIKQKYAKDIEAKGKTDHPQSLKTRQLIQDSYKLSCPAKATIARIIRFTSHKLEKNTEWQKKLLRKKLKSCRRDEIKYEEVFILEIPPVEAHRGHFTGKNAPGRQPLDERVGEKLVDLVVNEGITDTRTMEGHLRDYVHTKIYTRDTTPGSPNKRFFPDHKTIYNNIYSTLARELTSSDDQENVKKYVEDIAKTDDHQFLFRPLEDTTSENFLLVHQTKNQKDLMRRYGDEICLLDATYKTTRYSLPMFFVVVPTNTGYQVVGTFIVSTESSAAIQEALTELSRWNPEWKPANWMTDCCAAEQNAVFKDARVLLCDFHRMQAWNRYLVKLENGIPKLAAATLKRDYLVPLADSMTEAEYKNNRQKLFDSPEWKANAKFQAYMNRTWLSEETCQRWVHCFKTNRLMRSVRTNNGVETLNNSVKRFTKGPRQLNMLQFLKRLVAWHSRRYKRYCKGNLDLTVFNRRYSGKVPSALHQRPHRFIKHVLRRLAGARQLGYHNYTVSEGNNPRCNCPDFSRHSYPCKHIMQTWLSADGELLIPETLSNPWWTTDTSVIPQMYTPISVDCNSSPCPPDLSSQIEFSDDEVISVPESEQQPDRELEDLHSEIRESLKQLTGFSYENRSINSAKDMLSQLVRIKSSYLTKAKTESNIPLIPATLTKSKTQKRKALSIRQQDSALKPKKSRPLKYTNRGLLSQPKKETKHDSALKPTRRPAPKYRKHSKLSSYIVSDLESCTTVSKIEPLDTQGPSQDTSADTAKARPAAEDNEKLAVNLSLILDPHEQLDSDLITEALKLITKQHKDVVTQDCLLIQRKSCFEPALLFNHGDFCQVLHMKGANHWVSVTNIAAGDNDVRYFDSLGFTPTLKLFQAVASLVKTPSKKVRLRRENVQRQEGGVDCGLFAIANLIEVLNGGDPRKARMDQQKMRMHFFKCLSNQKWEPFPKQSSPVPRVDTADRHKSFSEYCVCRMPWNPNGLVKEDMVECPECGEWYHKGCIRIPPIAYCPITRDIQNFTCKPCIDRGMAVL